VRNVIEIGDNEILEERIAETVDRVYSKKRKDYQPGKYVFTNARGNVLKVTTITGPGKTEQSYKEDLDINRMLEPAIRKGLLRHVNKFEGEYDDIPVESFQDAQFIVSKGKNMYEALPSRIRAKFKGPGEFMEYVQNPENRPWLKKHGLLKGLDGMDRRGNSTGYNPEREVKEEQRKREQEAEANASPQP
jgi:hypothetical protein